MTAGPHSLPLVPLLVALELRGSCALLPVCFLGPVQPRPVQPRPVQPRPASAALVSPRWAWLSCLPSSLRASPHVQDPCLSSGLTLTPLVGSPGGTSPSLVAQPRGE